MHVFVKKSSIGIKCIFVINVEKKLKQFAENSFSVFKGAPFKPFEHTMTFSAKCIKLFALTFIKNAFATNSRFFSDKNMHVIKNNKIFHCKVLKLQRFSKVFPNVGENELFWRVIDPKST